MTVSELLDTLQAIEADGNGDARLYAYLDARGVKVQAEGKHPAPALVGVILRAPIEIRAGGLVVTP